MKDGTTFTPLPGRNVQDASISWRKFPVIFVSKLQNLQLSSPPFLTQHFDNLGLIIPAFEETQTMKVFRVLFWKNETSHQFQSLKTSLEAKANCPNLRLHEPALHKWLGNSRFICWWFLILLWLASNYPRIPRTNPWDIKEHITKLAKLGISLSRVAANVNRMQYLHVYTDITKVFWKKIEQENHRVVITKASTVTVVQWSSWWAHLQKAVHSLKSP